MAVLLWRGSRPPGLVSFTSLPRLESKRPVPFSFCPAQGELLPLGLPSAPFAVIAAPGSWLFSQGPGQRGDRLLTWRDPLPRRGDAWGPGDPAAPEPPPLQLLFCVSVPDDWRRPGHVAASASMRRLCGLSVVDGALQSDWLTAMGTGPA